MKTLSTLSGISVVQTGESWEISTVGLSTPGVAVSMTNPGVPFWSKHTRLLYCPWDQLIYGLGGDYGHVWGSYESGVPCFWKWDPRLPYPSSMSFAYPDGGNTPYGPPGEVQMSRPDQMAGAMDTLRKKFWVVVGQQWADSTAGVATQVQGTVMAWDWTTKKWESKGTKFYSAWAGGSAYDPVVDKVLAPQVTEELAEYDPNTSTWFRRGYFVGSPRTRHTDLLCHIDGRNLYFCDTQSYPGKVGILKVDLDSSDGPVNRRRATLLTTLPENVGAGRTAGILESKRIFCFQSNTFPYRSYGVRWDTGEVIPDFLPVFKDKAGNAFPPYYLVYYPPTDQLICFGNVWEVPAQNMLNYAYAIRYLGN